MFYRLLTMNKVVYKAIIVPFRQSKNLLLCNLLCFVHKSRKTAKNNY